jgi:hypothetical protein
MGRYEAAGTGLNDPATRKTLYKWAIVLGAVVLAGAITFGLLTLEDVQNFVDLALRLVGVLGGLGIVVTAALAKANVDPPAPDDSQVQGGIHTY